MKTAASKLLYVFAFILGAGQLISCAKENSNDVNQDRIYAEYELRYDANTDKTYASAIFRFGNATGTQLELSDPSTITFNGDAIPFDPVFSYYRKEYSGNITSGTFVFTNTEGTSFTNAVTNPRTVAFPAIDTIHNANSYTLTWIGDSVVSNEHMDMWMDGPQQNNAEFFTQYTLNTHNLVLAANQLQNLGIGATTCTLERTWETSAGSVTGAGGKVRAKYKAHDITIQVAP